jgi:hypothetical protein
MPKESAAVLQDMLKSNRIKEFLGPEQWAAIKKAALSEAKEQAQATALPKRPRPQVSQASGKAPTRPPTPEEVTAQLKKQFGA